ncbi:MAG: hypothetical protein KJO50_05360 [Bacteroidia bacterium]|nr:hypothetical protein [Bacteroidia bacterium]
MNHLSLFTKSVIIITLLLNVSCSDNVQDLDPCENVTCSQNEVCDNGICECLFGGTVGNCDEEIPNSVTLKKIIVSNVPPVNSAGDPWDSTGNPDLAVAIYNSLDDQLWFSGAIDEVDISEEHEFECDYKFTNMLLGSYRIPLTEWDANDYDIIGIMEFTPYQAGLGYPDTIVTINTIQAKLVLEYSF